MISSLSLLSCNHSATITTRQLVQDSIYSVSQFILGPIHSATETRLYAPLRVDTRFHALIRVFTRFHALKYVLQ